jgi:hypothetical protein
VGVDKCAQKGHIHSYGFGEENLLPTWSRLDGWNPVPHVCWENRVNPCVV